MILERLGGHDHHPRRAVADLRGVGGGDHPAFGEQLDRLDALERRIMADALVGAVQFGALGRFDFERDDFVGKGPGRSRRRRAAMAFKRELVELIAVEAMLARQHLGAHELAELDVRITGFLTRALRLAQPGLREQRAGRAHRHAGHRFDAGGDHHVLRARQHRLGGELDRLLRRSALAVDGDGGDAFRQLRRQHRATPDLEALLAALADTAHDDVVNRLGVDAGAVDEAVEHFAGHVGRVPAGQPAAAFAAGGAHGLNDIGFCHWVLSRFRFRHQLLPIRSRPARIK